MNIGNIDDLPPKYRDQAKDKLEAQKRNRPSGRDIAREQTKGSKYHNKKTEVDGITFDSKAEAERYQELLFMEQNGKISDLHLQQEFTLEEGYKLPNGKKVAPIRYKADFTYYDEGNNYIIEDVKGMETPIYKMKKNMMARQGHHITEIKK